MSSGFPNPPRPEIPGEGLSRATEDELERKAERYSRLHGEDDEAERTPGMLARLLKRIRGER